MAQTLEATEDLVIRAQAGDREAFERLVGEHSGLVAAVAAAHMSDPTEIDDLVQETFMTAWREISRLRKPESFGPWISAVARNLARAAATDHSRRSRLRPEAPRAASTAKTDDLHRRVLGAVEALPDGYREVFLLRYVAERDCAEIACELGIALGTVTSRLSRGHAMLRQKLEREARR